MCVYTSLYVCLVTVCVYTFESTFMSERLWVYVCVHILCEYIFVYMSDPDVCVYAHLYLCV